MTESELIKRKKRVCKRGMSWAGGAMLFCLLALWLNLRVPTPKPVPAPTPTSRAVVWPPKVEELKCVDCHCKDRMEQP